MLGKILESPLDSKEIKPINLKGNQPWMFVGMTDAETGAPILWLPDGKRWLTRKDPDSGKDWGQGEKRATEDELVGWHHQLNGHEFEQILGDSGGQRSLTDWSLDFTGHKEPDMTEQLNWEEPGVLQSIRVTESDMTEQQHSVKKVCLGKLWIEFLPIKL